MNSQVDLRATSNDIATPKSSDMGKGARGGAGPPAVVAEPGRTPTQVSSEDKGEVEDALCRGGGGKEQNAERKGETALRGTVDESPWGNCER